MYLQGLYACMYVYCNAMLIYWNQNEKQGPHRVLVYLHNVE